MQYYLKEAILPMAIALLSGILVTLFAGQIW